MGIKAEELIIQDPFGFPSSIPQDAEIRGMLLICLGA